MTNFSISCQNKLDKLKQAKKDDFVYNRYVLNGSEVDEKVY